MVNKLNPLPCPMCGSIPERCDLRVELTTKTSKDYSPRIEDWVIGAHIECTGDGCRCGGSDTYFDSWDSTPEEWWDGSVRAWNNRGVFV